MSLTPEQISQYKDKYGFGSKFDGGGNEGTTNKLKQDIQNLQPAGQTNIANKQSFTQGIVSDFKKRDTAMREAQQSNQGVGSKILQTYGQGAGFVGDVVKRGFSSVGQMISDVTPDNIKQPISQGFSDGIKDIVSTDTGKSAIEALSRGQEAYSQFKQTSPEYAKNLESTVNIVSILPILQGLRDAGLLAETGLVLSKNVLNTGVDATKSIVSKSSEIVKPIINTGVDVTKSIYDTAKLSIGGASRIPERITTNIAEKKAIQDTIKTLPTETSKRAVQDGVDIRDVKILNNIPKDQKRAVSILVKNVQEFESGVSKVDPMETVGKPFVDRLNVLKTNQARIGKELGDVANNLGDISEAELFFPVYDSLKKTRGLEGLKLAEDGTLDFTETTLATAETASDRAAIQSIFDSATTRGTGKQKHLLRQELRESLGGKKKGGVQLTGTQEQAYESIRRGLSDALDNANSKYREVNANYARVSKPIDELSTILKVGDESTDDILNLTGGILARRLTSAGIGNANIRRVLQLVDNATKVKGKTLVSVETLQDVMNVLNRYYDIAPRTGYQKLTEEGVSRGIGDFITGSVGDVAGKTDAVRKKALENMLKELLSD